jgi:predicted NBD/HSP70 family sugar kinase
LTDAAAPQARRARAAERESLAQIVNLVRSGTATTRHDLERVSGLGRAVVADRLATLLRSGLIVEEGLGPSTGGRAPRQVRFNSGAGYVLVSSLGTTTLGVGLADLSGQLLIEHHEPADVTRGPEATMGRVDELFGWMLDEHPAAREAWAVVLGVPGLVGPAAGRLGAGTRLQQMPGWTNFPVYEHLSSRYDAPALLANEVHLMALGELRSGYGVGRDELIFVKIGTGISAGLCADGRIHRGASGYAGDIGHVAVLEDSPTICRCGNTGCLEAVAGGTAIAREGDAAARDGRSPYLAAQLSAGAVITAAHVGAAANMGDPFSLELISRSGRLVGETLATLITAFNPSLVVVGGGVAQAGGVLLAAIRDGIYRRSRSVATENLRLVRSELGKTAGLVGGALAALDDLFAPSYLKAWVEHGSPRMSAIGGAGSRQRALRSGVASAGARAGTATVVRRRPRPAEPRGAVR